jgi:hypothetical protein
MIILNRYVECQDWNNNGHLFVHHPKLVFDKAEEECVRRGGHLVSVHSQAEYDYITSFPNP